MISIPGGKLYDRPIMHDSTFRRGLLAVVLLASGGGLALGEPEVSSLAKPSGSAPQATSVPASGLGHDFFFTALTENDSKVYNPFNSSDRHYTNGAKAVFAIRPPFAADWATALPALGADFSKPRAAFGIQSGQEIYTPEDPDIKTLIKDDRPYVGWLYFGAFLQRSSPTVMDHLELDVGMVGPSSLAHQAQDMVHELLGYEEFMGWNNQLHDEPAFNFSAERRWRVGRATLSDELAFDVVPHAGLTAGTVNRHLELGTTLRLGWGLGEDFGPGNIHHPLDYTAPRPPQAFYAFVRLSGRAVEHNLFLQGNSFRDSPRVDAEPLVGDATTGLTLAFCRHVELSYSQTYLGREFKHQRTQDSYGAFVLTIAMEF